MVVSIIVGLIISANLMQLFRAYLIDGVFSVSRPGPDAAESEFVTWQTRVIIHFFATSAFTALSFVASTILVNKALHKLVQSLHAGKDRPRAPENH
jgi:hypothetical protein